MQQIKYKYGMLLLQCPKELLWPHFYEKGSFSKKSIVELLSINVLSALMPFAAATVGCNAPSNAAAQSPHLCIFSEISVTKCSLKTRIVWHFCSEI